MEQAHQSTIGKPGHRAAALSETECEPIVLGYAPREAERIDAIAHALPWVRLLLILTCLLGLLQPVWPILFTRIAQLIESQPALFKPIFRNYYIPALAIEILIAVSLCFAMLSIRRYARVSRAAIVAAVVFAFHAIATAANLFSNTARWEGIWFLPEPWVLWSFEAWLYFTISPLLVFLLILPALLGPSMLIRRLFVLVGLGFALAYSVVGALQLPFVAFKGRNLTWNSGTASWFYFQQFWLSLASELRLSRIAVLLLLLSVAIVEREFRKSLRGAAVERQSPSSSS